MGSNDNATTDTTAYPFSIRHYVLEARKQDIHNNWPFHEKYLEICMKHDVNKLLPPFKSLDSVGYSSYKERVQSSVAHEDNNHIGSNNSSCVETNRKKEFFKVGTDLCIDEEVSEITKQMSPLSLFINEHKQDGSGLSSDIPDHPMDMKVHTSNFKSRFDHPPDQSIPVVPSTKSDKRRKKHKGKHKKRSMAEIYAEATPCTLKDLDDNNESTLQPVPRMMTYICDQGAKESKKNFHGISEGMNNVDQVYDSAESLQMMNCIINDNEENKDYLGERKQTVKIKFSGCKSKAINRKALCHYAE